MAKDYFVVAHWSTLIENFNVAPTKFYEQVEMEIKKRNIPDITLATSEMKEGGIFSTKRLYFTVERKRYCLDICGAPFGTGFFVSSWLSFSLTFLQSILLPFAVVPVLGKILAPAIGDITLYQQDTTRMFQQSVHNAVLDVIDGITKTQGLKILSEGERKPVMSEFYQPKSLRR